MEVEKQTGMARTTLITQVPMQQYPLLSVIRLLGYSHGPDKTFLSGMRLKPVREFDEKNKSHTWTGYIFKHRGQPYAILEGEAPTTSLLPAEAVVETVQESVDGNPIHQDRRSPPQSVTTAPQSKNDGESGGVPKSPVVIKSAGVPDNRRSGRSGMTRRLRVRSLTQKSSPVPNVPSTTQLDNFIDLGAELPISTPAVIEDTMGQPTLMDIADHQDTMNSLIQPLLPSSSRMGLSPSPIVSGEVPIKA
jgi:hypothetical protein